MVLLVLFAVAVALITVGLVWLIARALDGIDSRRRWEEFEREFAAHVRRLRQEA